MKTEDLIVRLTRTLEPVVPLPRPMVRATRWAAISLAAAGAGAIVVGLRADLPAAIREPAFAILVVMAVLTAVSSAVSALVLSVPGEERSPAQRGVPILIAAFWTATLVAALAAGGDSIPRLLSLPVHPACVVEIGAFAAIPGWALFAMLRRAAPLHVGWSAALAGLAATALGAGATQLVCPIDDPAHHLVGHLLPMGLFTIGIAAARWRSLVWWSDRV